MNMRLWRATVVLTALVTVAWPYDGRLPGTRGLAIGGGGGGTGPDALGFTVQPSDATAGNIITPAIQVTVRDSLGNVDLTFTAGVTMSVGVNPTGGRLSGTLTVAPVNGVARFGDLVIDQSGAGYALRASASGARSASSPSFTIFLPYPRRPRRGRLPISRGG